MNEGMRRDERPLAGRVRELTADFLGVWRRSAEGRLELGTVYAPAEQRQREGELDAFLKAVGHALERPPRLASERSDVQKRILGAFDRFARNALDFSEAEMTLLLGRGLPDLSLAFAQAARRFDNGISGADIFQAGRNAWTMHGMQLLLGLPAELTPAVLGYSLLYPYTDNFLDDPAVPPAAKTAFSERFRRRLAGQPVAASTAHEEKIFALVGLIEGQFERPAYPCLYESLLAIHDAQTDGLRLHRASAGVLGIDVWGLSAAKGGTSVLADGFLIAGDLTPAQERFLYGWGVFVQLVDDLQDVESDGQAGIQTIFSVPARQGLLLDGLTDQLLRFGHSVNALMDEIAGAGPAKLPGLMARSADLLLIEAAGMAGERYTPAGLRRLEAHSPFRFRTLRDRQRRLARRGDALTGLLETFAAGGGSEALWGSAA